MTLETGVVLEARTVREKGAREKGMVVEKRVFLEKDRHVRRETSIIEKE